MLPFAMKLTTFKVVAILATRPVVVILKLPEFRWGEQITSRQPPIGGYWNEINVHMGCLFVEVNCCRHHVFFAVSLLNEIKALPEIVRLLFPGHFIKNAESDVTRH